MNKSLHILAVLLLLAMISGCKGGKQTGNNDELAGLPRTSFSTGGVTFSLANVKDLELMNRDSVDWGHLIPQTEENGPIVYYFTTTIHTLASPHIRIEYIDKKIENMGTVESINGWLKSLFMNDYQQGKILNENETLTTLDGQDVKLLEIHRPSGYVNDSVQRGDKYMAWSYVDHNDRFVAFNFSTTEESDYNDGMPLFKDLVRSYKDE